MVLFYEIRFRPTGPKVFLKAPFFVQTLPKSAQRRRFFEIEEEQKILLK